MDQKKVDKKKLFDVFYDGVFYETMSYEELAEQAESMREEYERWTILPNGFNVRHQYGLTPTLH